MSTSLLAALAQREQARISASALGVAAITSCSTPPCGGVDAEYVQPTACSTVLGDSNLAALLFCSFPEPPFDSWVGLACTGSFLCDVAEQLVRDGSLQRVDRGIHQRRLDELVSAEVLADLTTEWHDALCPDEQHPDEDRLLCKSIQQLGRVTTRMGIITSLEELSDMFQAVDVDQSGALSCREFMLLLLEVHDENDDELMSTENVSRAAMLRGESESETIAWLMSEDVGHEEGLARLRDEMGLEQPQARKARLRRQRRANRSCIREAARTVSLPWCMVFPV